MGDVVLAPVGERLAAEVEQFLASQSVELPAVWSGPVERGYVEQVRVVPSAVMAGVLSDAVGLIEREGWTRGRYSDGSGFCLVGAVEAAGLAAGFVAGRGARLCVELALVAATGSVNPIGWNDDLRRSKGEVLQLLAGAVTVARTLGR